MQVYVGNDRPYLIRKFNGQAAFLLVNQDAANDVWIDSNPNDLATVGQAGNPTVGTKLAHAGGEVQWEAYRGREVWGRAGSGGSVMLEVQP